MKTTASGHNAEEAAANYLTSQGFSVLAKNWRTKTCEIDIVAKKDNVIYFCEVKYRGSDFQGDGFEYITPAKLKQVTYAAQTWVNEQDWDGDYRLLAAAVSGDAYQDVEITEI